MPSYNTTLHESIKDYTSMSCFSLLIHQMARDMAHRKKDAILVELGVNCGNSTIALVTALLPPSEARLHSCDIERCDAAVAAVSNLGGECIWNFTQMDSISFACEFDDNTVSLVFLDTDHEYENTKDELIAWTPKLISEGRLLLHDTCTAPDRVGRAVTEFRSSNPGWSYYNIDVECGLGVLTKPR